MDASRNYESNSDLEALREQALSGSVEAQTYLGWMHHTGTNVRLDLNEATRWYQLAADAGSKRARYYLAGLFRLQGDFSRALAEFHQLENQGYPPASYVLGAMYSRGEGTPVDPVTAVEYFDDAAAAGNLYAQWAVAGEMLRGKGGAAGMLRGLFLLVGTVARLIVVASRDPYDERLLH